MTARLRSAVNWEVESGKFMFNSLELRWFLSGKLPSDVVTWFEQDELGGQLRSPEAREDVYLYTPECEYMGIKLRQGRLEIKWRQAELEILSFAKVEGKLEKWGKWLCEDPTAESFKPENVLGQKSWVSVKKVRSQRSYDGCSLELTQLNFQDNAWWTLAFETIGTDARAMDNLQNISQMVFKTYPKSISVQNSYAYPKWLEMVVGKL